MIGRLMYNRAFINQEIFPRLADGAALCPESENVDDPVKIEEILENQGVKLR